MATCRNGRVSNAVEFVHSSSSKRNYSRDDKSMDMYDVYDYDDPEDFYYDHVDEFDDIQDAEDYWDGETDELASETMAAVGRIATEREATKADSPARVILLMISGMMDDAELRKAVMKKGKRAGKLLKKMRKTAKKHETGGTGVCCGTDKQLKDLIRAYYLQTDEELDEKLEALYK